VARKRETEGIPRRRRRKGMDQKPVLGTPGTKQRCEKCGNPLNYANPFSLCLVCQEPVRKRALERGVNPDKALARYRRHL
jgi:ribosomal protein S14